MNYKGEISNILEDSTTKNTGSNKEIDQKYEHIRDECLQIIQYDDYTQYCQALNLLIELMRINNEVTLELIMNNQLLNVILERMDLSHPYDVVNSFEVIKNIIEIEKYRDAIYQSDLVQNIMIWLHNTLDNYILADIVDIITRLIKYSKEFFILLIETSYITEFYSYIITIAINMNVQDVNSKFSKSLFKFLSCCYYFNDVIIPEPLFYNIPDYIFSTLLNSKFDELDFKLKPLIVIIKNFHNNFILKFTEVEKLSVLINILMNIQDNEIIHEKNLKIAQRTCVLLDLIFTEETNVPLLLTNDDLINIHFFEALSQTINTFPEVSTNILSIIGKMVILELVFDPEIPLELISKANTELSLQEKNSYALLFYSCSRVLYNSFCQFVYKNFDMIDGILDILYGQDPSNIYNIMEGLVNVIEFAKAYDFDVNLIVNKLTEHDITEEFIQETMDLFSNDMNIYECCIRFLSEFKTDISEDLNSNEYRDEYD